MTTKNVIIFTNQDGGVSVCVPTGEIPVEAVQSKDIPVGVQSHIVDQDSLPNEHNDFFNAWEQINGAVTVNMDKAREITKARLRVERAPLLAAQDVLFMKAQETGADTTAIVAEKNRLRDITNLVNSATTLEALLAITCEA